jgi:hypothetical protein
MDARLTKLETLVPTLATKADVSEVRADLHKVSSEMKGWFIATAVLVLVGLFTITNIMISQVRSMQPGPSPAATHAEGAAHSLPPIVIQVPSPPPAPQQTP